MAELMQHPLDVKITNLNFLRTTTEITFKTF